MKICEGMWAACSLKCSNGNLFGILANRNTKNHPKTRPNGVCINTQFILEHVLTSFNGYLRDLSVYVTYTYGNARETGLLATVRGYLSRYF